MELEFYFPKTKSKHRCIPTTGKVYPSKGGTIRYGVQATMNGSKSLPKYINEEEFNRLGFSAETFEASVSVGEKQVRSRKDYDIDNDISVSNLTIDDVDLDDYADEIISNYEDEIAEAIRENVDDSSPISDGDTGYGDYYINTNMTLDVPISGNINFDWTANENYDDVIGDEWNAETFESDKEYLSRKEDVAGLDDYERYQLYDDGRMTCDECGADDKTVGFVEEGYKLCGRCDREWMAKQGYEAETTTFNATAYSMIEYQDDNCLKEIADSLRPKYNLEWNEGDLSWDWDSKTGDVILYIYDGDNKKLDEITYDRKALAKALKEQGYKNPESWGAETFGAESGQMCEVCFGNDDMPYDSDHFTECRRCGKSVCIDCEGEMEHHPEWSKVCAECSNVLDNVHDYGAETFESQNSNMKLALGLTGLGIGLALWKGKELLSLWDRIKEKME